MPAASAICFGSPGPPSDAAADEPLADARDAEEVVELVEERRRALRDVLERVAAKHDGEVVRLEPRRVRVAREPDRVLEHPHGLPARGRRPQVDGEMPLRLCRNVVR